VTGGERRPGEPRVLPVLGEGADPAAPEAPADLASLFPAAPRQGAPLSSVLPEESFARPAPPQRPPPRPSWDPELPPAGAVLDKYRLDALVGCGAFAAVYRATHLLLRAPVAIKLLRPAAMRRMAGLAELLCEEARYAARIDHPNVVRIHDVTHHPSITYVVLEYVDGENLSRILAARGALAPRVVAELGLEVVAGLRAALEQGLIHRDVKPSNILLTRSGHAKLVDLGLALPLHRDPGARLPQLTVVGTPGYMAPEQGIDPGAVDFRADVYALGATLYHAAVGRPPFPLDDARRCLELHRTARPEEPHRRRPEVGEDLSRLLMAMLAKRREDRPGSYDQIARALQEVRTALPDGGLPPAAR
jgi:eukaryotic-like serine/threonine-protein kinase